jgi:hypothetical protein
MGLFSLVFYLFFFHSMPALILPLMLPIVLPLILPLSLPKYTPSFSPSHSPSNFPSFPLTVSPLSFSLSLFLFFSYCFYSTIFRLFHTFFFVVFSTTHFFLFSSLISSELIYIYLILFYFFMNKHVFLV